MADFKYTFTKENSYTIESNVVKATSKEEAIGLIPPGLNVVDITEIKTKKNISLFSSKNIKLVDKVLFFDHMSQMIKAGLSINETLEALIDDNENEYFKSVIKDIKYEIEAGGTFSKAMSKYPKVFSTLEVKMIEVGEITGTLEETAYQISIQSKKDFELRSKIKGALIYPEILSSIMVLAGVGLIVFVVPQLKTFFMQANMQLPLTTQILIDISTIITGYWYVFVLAIALIIFFFPKLKKNKEFANGLDWIILRTPIIGEITKKLSLAIFTRTLGSLLKSGVSVNKSIELTATSIPNSIYRSAVLGFTHDIEEGVPLYKLMEKRTDIFTNLSIRMAFVGDKTGNLPDMLINIADFYQNQVNDTLSNISTIIEPVMLFIMGGATLFIALSVILPIYQLTSGISGMQPAK